MFHLFSDIHLEHGDVDISRFEKVHGNIAILAGDICSAKRIDSAGLGLQYQRFFELMVKNFNHVLYVMGNHEHYKYDLSLSYTKLKQYLPSGITLLENEAVMVDGIKYIGATLWTNFYDRDPIAMWQVQQKLNDYRAIRNNRRLIAADTARLHDNSFNYIKHEVEKGEPCVVITHHAPSMQSIDPAYKVDYLINSAYASNLEPFILSHENILGWVHGHVHCSNNYTIGKTHVFANPLGYPQCENPNFSTTEFKL